MQTWQDREMKGWHPRCQELYAYLLKLGIREHVAYSLVDREIPLWSKDEVAAILSTAIAPGAGLPQYTVAAGRGTPQSAVSSVAKLAGKLFSQAASSQSLPSTAEEVWIKPSTSLSKQSAEEGKALCVNRQGAFSLRQDGYYAISHVWAEGIQGDAQNRGLSKHILDKVFEKLQVLKDAEWIWLDVVAIPAGNAALSAAQELEKIGIINTLSAVYRNAQAVVIFDALLMQMKSREPCNVAMGLLCGRWMSRVWTFQEGKLAKRIVILTADGPVSYDDMLSGLKKLNGDASWKMGPGVSDTRPAADRKYRQIYMSLDVLYQSDNGCSIPDVAFSCRDRETGNDIDYVRALFPVLGLTWKSGMTKEDGLRHLYENKYLQAAQIMTMFGQPRTMNYPGWAPDNLSGLEGNILYLATRFQNTRAGLIHDWHTLRITSTEKLPMFQNAWLVGLQDTESTKSAQCGVFACAGESQATLSAMEQVVKKGHAYFLTHDPLTKRGVSGLFVEKVDSRAKERVSDGRIVSEEDCQGYCYAVLRVEAFDRTLPTVARQWTIFNENPMCQASDGGRKQAELMTWLQQREAGYDEATMEALREEMTQLNIDSTDRQGRTMLHLAAADGNVELVKLCIAKGAAVDKPDPEKSTALNIAAHKGHLDVVKVLLEAGANINHVGWIATPLTEAILANDNTCVEYLLQKGARADGEPHGAGDFLWPLMHANNNAELTGLLLRFGADPDRHSDQGLCALQWAARSGNDTVVRLLLQAGAQPDRFVGQHDPLRYAIESRSERCVAELLYHGADANAVYEQNHSPLTFAAQCGHPQITRLLLDAGARSDQRADDLGTAVDIARAGGHRLVLKMLSEEDRVS